MKLLHYSGKRLTINFDKKYPVDMCDGMKPSGLWVSVQGEDDWKAWCEAENFRLETLRIATEVVLYDNANILLIDTVEMLDAFHTRYARGLYSGSTVKNIDWATVKKIYDGIIIAPYRWERRMELGMLWYYGWDCASGCIWNLRRAIRMVHYYDAQKETA